jgi:uncharacterized protein
MSHLKGAVLSGGTSMFRVVPKDEKFYDQIEQLSHLAKSTAQNMNDLVSSFPRVDGIPDQLAKAKDEAAEVMQSTLERLDEAFITPIDREDIMQLITDLYDVIELVADVARRFSLYKMTELYPNLKSQSDTLCKVAAALDGVLSELRDDKKLKELSGQLKEILALQKLAAANRDAFLSELFAGSPDPLEVMKKKELHDMLEDAIWHCENVARTLGRVLLKNG